MRIVFMGKHKRSAAGALAYALERGCEVAAVVCPPPDELTHDSQRVDLVAQAHSLPLVTDDDLYAAIADPAGSALQLGEVDLVVSFLFWKRMRPPLIELGRIGCVNLHPAPLPDLRGVGGYNVAILEGRSEWGVSAHFVDAQLDTGDLIRVERFPIDPDAATALSLDLESQERLHGVFRWLLDTALDGGELPRTPQGEGRYVSRAELERLRRIPADADADAIERHARAFWYPPWPGATIALGGREFTLVDDATLRALARERRDAGPLP